MPIPHLKHSQSWKDKPNTSHARPVKGYRQQVYSAKKAQNIWQKWKPKIFSWALTGAALLFLVIFISFAWLSRDLPSPNQLMEREVAQSTQILDRSGEHTLYEIHGEEKRTLIKLEEIPEYVKWATISIEDKNFYKHGGFSIWAMFRTVVTNVIYNRKAGGSTLTQQFIKNAVLSSEKKYSRKIKELILAQRIEKKFTKDEILQMYLNEIPYGSNAYGVEAAAQKYFGKSVKDINLAEAAVLAALPQAPSRYSPYGPNQDILIGRQQYILDQMVKQEYINEDEAEAAKLITIEFKKPNENITAPHFVMYIKEILSEHYGEKTVEQGGLKIYTTLDFDKQKMAEDIITEKAETNQEKYNASNAALVAIDPKTGQILAMVGSKNYFNDEIDGQFNVATSPRQPGSSMKPLVYATLFTKGFTPNTVLYDVVTNFSASGDKYEPHNYNLKENGPVTIKKALGGSLNIPAVKAIYLAGIDNVLSLAQDLGYTTLNDKDRFGLSLVLGGAEVKLLEHTNAFSAFARNGEISSLVSILKVEDKDGNVLEEVKEPKTRKVLPTNVAEMINSILTDNSARAWMFGEKNYLTLGSRPVGAKTGTTNDYRDAWTIGYTPSLVTGVWVGNNDNSEMNRGADGSVVAAPIWNAFMQKALENTPIENFNINGDYKTGNPVIDGEMVGKATVKIDTASGLLATEYTPEEYIKEVENSAHHCILYYLDKDDPLGSQPRNPEKDSQFNLWESAVLDWAKREDKIASSSVPTEYDNVHLPENRPTIEIINPKNKSTLDNNQLNVDINASAPRGIAKISYYIDEALIEEVYTYPFSLKKNISFLNNGYHTLKAKACDDVGNCSETLIDFNVKNSTVENLDSDISLIFPTEGMAINKDIDFPLEVRLAASNNRAIAEISVYYQINGEIKQLNNTQDVINLRYRWPEPDLEGKYELWAKMKTWTGQEKETNHVNIYIQ